MAGLRAFFEAHERYSNAGDFEALVSLYAESFASADADGTRVVQATDLRAALPKRKQMLAGIGCKAARLAALDETRLDQHYVLAKTTWRWEFERPGWPEIILASTFIVRTSGAAPAIVFYLNHENILTVLRDRGLLPPAV